MERKLIDLRRWCGITAWGVKPPLITGCYEWRGKRIAYLWCKPRHSLPYIRVEKHQRSLGVYRHMQVIVEGKAAQTVRMKNGGRGERYILENEYQQ
jgi:hypothetical protein